MKIQKETALFQTPAGSHLFGTNHETSDFDFKVVCLPSFEDLLLNKQLTNRVVKPEGLAAGDKMKAGEAEYEFIPLQVFLTQFYEGQTYAIEAAFAVLNDLHTTLEYNFGELSIADDSTRIQQWMTELVSRFLTRDSKKMVDFAVAQSRNYGLKTERYSTMVKFVELIEAYCKTVPQDKRPANHKTHGDNQLSWYRVGELEDLLVKLLQMPHVSMCMLENGDGGKTLVPGIEICNKRFPFTTTWNTVVKSINGSLQGYGNRVKDHEGQPADWKALSHAIRIVDQIIELNQVGKMSFPRANAKFLLDIKQGKIDFDEATAYLTERFNLVDEVVATSVLPEKTPELENEFQDFKLSLLKSYYRL